MNNQDTKALHQLTISELSKKLAELKVSLAKSVMEKQAGKLKNVRISSTQRDQIARVMSVMREKTLVTGQV